MVAKNSGHPCTLIWLWQTWNLLIIFIVFYLSFFSRKCTCCTGHVDIRDSSAKSRWEREKSLLVLLFQRWICDGYDGSLYRNARYLIILRLGFRSIWRPRGIHGLMAQVPKPTESGSGLCNCAHLCVDVKPNPWWATSTLEGGFYWDRFGK